MKREKMPRQNISSGSYLEPIIGISRLVRVGNMIFIGGTAPIGVDGKCHGVGDIEAQTRRCFDIAKASLEKAGASFADVVRTRLILTNIADWKIVAKVHGEIFGEIRPVTTTMAVSGFVDPDWLVEIEIDAVLAD
jgi:enamine deaminase RidA (YjgF/YER057c/UK114 family)